MEKISSEIVNTELMQHASHEKFVELEFIVCYDGSPLGDKQPESVWGISYEMENDSFAISIDCAYVVSIKNKQNDSEWIKCHCLNIDDLESIIQFITPE